MAQIYHGSKLKNDNNNSKNDNTDDGSYGVYDELAIKP